MTAKLLKLLTADELTVLSKFLIDVAKGILGVPLVVYFISGFSALVLITGFMLDLVAVVSLMAISFKLERIAKRRPKWTKDC